MIAEIDFHGVFVPALLVWTILTIPLSVLLRRVIEGLGLYRFIWHRSLFDLALFIILLGGIVAAVSWWTAS